MARILICGICLPGPNVLPIAMHLARTTTPLVRSRIWAGDATMKVTLESATS